MAVISGADSQVVFATVLNCTPVIGNVQERLPKRVFNQEQVASQESTSYTPSILGGIIGAAVGNEFGKGRGNDLATIAGGVLGASVGRDVQNSKSQNHTTTVERCHDEIEYVYEERVTGWRVTYEFNSETFITRTDRDPGETIRLTIQIQSQSWFSLALRAS